MHHLDVLQEEMAQSVEPHVGCLAHHHFTKRVRDQFPLKYIFYFYFFNTFVHAMLDFPKIAYTDLA